VPFLGTAQAWANDAKANNYIFGANSNFFENISNHACVLDLASL